MKLDEEYSLEYRCELSWKGPNPKRLFYGYFHVCHARHCGDFLLYRGQLFFMSLIITLILKSKLRLVLRINFISGILASAFALSYKSSWEMNAILKIAKT